MLQYIITLSFIQGLLNHSSVIRFKNNNLNMYWHVFYVHAHKQHILKTLMLGVINRD